MRTPRLSPTIDIIVVGEVDGPTREFSGHTLTVDRAVAERLIQEEVWAQTVWPEGEPSLADLIRALEGSRTVPK